MCLVHGSSKRECPSSWKEDWEIPLKKRCYLAHKRGTKDTHRREQEGGNSTYPSPPPPLPKSLLNPWAIHPGACSLSSAGLLAVPSQPGVASLQERLEALSVADLIQCLLQQLLIWTAHFCCIPLEAALAHLYLANKPAWALEEMEAIYSKLFN